jgi:NAD-specific glutamate dehydrogenase
VREDARRARWDIAEHALADTPDGDPVDALDAFLAAHGEGCRRLGGFMRTLSREGESDMAGLALAVRQLRDLAE